MEKFKKVEFGSYNFRRYGKPWAAQVKLKGVKVVLIFLDGSYAGNADGGSVVIPLEKNSVFAYGQKDNRKPSNSETYYFAIDAEGEEKELENQSEARDFLINL